MTNEKIIDKIQAARAKNNWPWMEILRIAFREAPEEAAACMQKICDLDTEITGLARQLAQENCTHEWFLNKTDQGDFHACKKCKKKARN